MNSRVDLYVRPSSLQSQGSQAWGYRQSLIHSCKVGLAGAALNALIALMLYVSGLMQGSPVAHLDAWPFKDPALAVAVGFLDAVALSPVVETAFMFVPFWILRRLRVSVDLVPFVSGAIWAVLHTKGHAWLPLLTFIPFFLFTVQLQRENRFGQNRALLAVSFSHGVYNLALIMYQYLVFGPITGTASLF